MKSTPGRKARDDRYYAANKNNINRRRRERRKRKKERAELGIPMLQLVEDHGSSEPDHGMPDLDVSDPEAPDRPGMNRLASDHAAMDHAATDHGASDHAASDHAASDHAASDHGASDHAASDHGASDHAASDHAASDHGALDYAASDHGASDHRAPDHAASDLRASAPGASDHEARTLATAFLANDITFDQMGRPSMENLQFQSNVRYLQCQGAPNQAAVDGDTRASNAQPNRKTVSRMPLLVGFHLGVTVGLSVLGTCLQYEFYKEHDVLPGYALWLAIAGAGGMLSLATLKIEGFCTDLCRKLICAAFYIFMVISSSYHVLNAAWLDASKVVQGPVVGNAEHSESRERAIGAVTDALNKATKKGAWKVMETLGAALSADQSAGTAPVSPKPFGISSELMIGAGAGIVIVLRALLEGIQIITAVAIRDYLLSKQRSS